MPKQEYRTNQEAREFAELLLKYVDKVKRFGLDVSHDFPPEIELTELPVELLVQEQMQRGVIGVYVSLIQQHNEIPGESVTTADDYRYAMGALREAKSLLGDSEVGRLASSDYRRLIQRMRDTRPDLAEIVLE